MKKELYSFEWPFTHALALNSGAPVGCADNILGVGDLNM